MISRTAGPRRSFVSLVTRLLLAASLAAALPSTAHAQAPDAAKIKEAGAHFERGVGLYKEADYRGALVEFKRAHEIAPNATVRFNLGQAQYQLRDYPAALTTFESYLSEAPANAPNRGEAEAAVAQLKGRVGTLRFAGPAGGEILLADESLGKLPVAPHRVPVGSHKVVLVSASGTRTAKTVDVVGGASVEVTFAETESGPREPTPPAAPTTSAAPTVPPPAAESERGPWPVVAWVVTGVAAAGAVTTGIVAQSSSSKLTDLKQREGVTRTELDDTHGRMRTFAITSDVLTGVAVVSGGAALYLTLRSPSKSTAIHVGPTSLSLSRSF